MENAAYMVQYEYKEGKNEKFFLMNLPMAKYQGL